MSRIIVFTGDGKYCYGLKKTREQWIRFAEERGHMVSSSVTVAVDLVVASDDAMKQCTSKVRKAMQKQVNYLSV